MATFWETQTVVLSRIRNGQRTLAVRDDSHRMVDVGQVLSELSCNPIILAVELLPCSLKNVRPEAVRWIVKRRDTQLVSPLLKRVTRDVHPVENYRPVVVNVLGSS